MHPSAGTRDPGIQVHIQQEVEMEALQKEAPETKAEAVGRGIESQGVST